MKLKDVRVGKINITWFFLISFILLALTILGIFLDVNISVSLMDTSSEFGKFFEDYGHLPGYSMIILAVAIMTKIFFKEDSDKRQKSLGVFCAAVMTVAVTYLSTRDINNSLDFGWNFLIAGLFYIVIFMLAFFFVDKSLDELELFRVGLLILIISVVSIGINGFLLNNLWIRSLPKVIITSWTAEPMPLYEMVFEPFSGYTSSFISAHATSATLLIALPLAFSVFKGDSKLKQIIALSCAGVFILVMYLSRIIYGMNYLTDLTISSFVVVDIIVLTVVLDAVRQNKVKTE